MFSFCYNKLLKEYTMSEKDKMITGALYDSSDEMLTNERLYAEKLMFEFNNLSPYKNVERLNILKRLLGRIGKNTFIRSTLYCDYGYNIEFGDNCYANHNLTILDCAKVTFGDNVFIAPNCGFYTATHPIVAGERNTLLEYAKPIRIGNNVWFGANVIVLPGVTIADNAVIGAGSVVTKDIPANVVAVGNPCRVVREITDKDKMLHK